MRKLLAAALLALPLAACQTTAGPGPQGLARLEAAGFQQSGNMFLCAPERCGQAVVIAYHRQSISLQGAPFTAEGLIKSKVIDRAAAERFLLATMNASAKPTDRFTQVRFDKRDASFAVRGTRRSETLTLHMAGRLSYRGNDMVGHVVVSPDPARAARYLAFAPVE